MLVKIYFSNDAPDEEIINLCDYGYEVTTRWDDLTTEQQNEIRDNLVEQYNIHCGAKELDFNDYNEHYQELFNDEEIELIEEFLKK